LQPDDTGAAPWLEHPDAMVRERVKKVVARATTRTESIPELKPWREVGWIFNDGEAVAIERQDDETRVRLVEHGRGDS